MIIKIKVESKYYIFDNVSNVNYYIKSKESSKEKIEEDNKEILINNLTNSPIKYNCISFEDKNTIKQTIIFDTVAYICNDEGKTIEIIRV
jgi:hypothetical protein